MINLAKSKLFWVLTIVISLVVTAILTTTCKEKYYSNGNLEYRILSNSLLNLSPCKLYYPNGNLQVKGYLKGAKMSGKFYFYGEDQTVFCTSEYKNGMRDGITYKYHKNGKISEKYSYRLGKIDGIGEEYYEDGKLMSRYSYKQGKLDGAGTRYFANGNISNLSNYDRGMKVGKLLSFLDDGKVKGIEYYFKDSLYFQKIYKFSSNQVCIDSHEFVRPLISIGGNFVKGGLLIVNMKVITEGIPYDRDSFYVKFDMDYKDEKSGFFPYPRLIQTFVGKEEISHTYVIDSIRPGLSLYGSLEYHRTDGSIFDSDDFEYPLRRSGD